MYDAVFKALKEELAVHGATLGNDYKLISDWEQAEVSNKLLNIIMLYLFFFREMHS